jgi:hypothetical protein
VMLIYLVGTAGCEGLSWYYRCTVYAKLWRLDPLFPAMPRVTVTHPSSRPFSILPTTFVLLYIDVPVCIDDAPIKPPVTKCLTKKHHRDKTSVDKKSVGDKTSEKSVQKDKTSLHRTSSYYVNKSRIYNNYNN